MRVVIMRAYVLISVYRAYAILAQDVLREAVDTVAQNVPRLKLKCSSCGFTMFTVITDQHSAAISVQAVYSLTGRPVSKS